MILHLDGDAFFATCEVSLHPEYRGKPLVVGGERGIITALTYEAKAKGLSRGLPMYIAKKICPEVIVVPGDYRSYGLISARMLSIVRRFFSVVEEYSIDECFAYFPTEEKGREEIVSVLEKIRLTLFQELGVTFSLGLAPTKVLAKVASKHSKPYGLTIIWPELISEFLKDLPLEKVWGIGGATSASLRDKGLQTCGAFMGLDERHVQKLFSKPLIELWYELRGVSLYSVHSGSREKHKTIAKTRTFRNVTDNKYFLFSELSKNIENACARARGLHLAAREISFFLKTNEFRYHSTEMKLPQPTSSPEEILRAVEKNFACIYTPGVLYRASGITLRGLSDSLFLPHDLFGEGEKLRKEESIHRVADSLEERFGTDIVFLASSLNAKEKNIKARWEELRDSKTLDSFQRLPIPFWGHIS